MTDAKTATIAKGLSEARLSSLTHKLTKDQRFILLNAPPDDWFPVCYEGFWGLFRSLNRMGLTAPREPGSQVLTPLGLAVRNHLRGAA